MRPRYLKSALSAYLVLLCTFSSVSLWAAQQASSAGQTSQLAVVKPADLKTEILKNRQLFRTGRLAEAQQRLQRLLRQYPDDARVHYWLGQVLIKRGDPDAGLEHIARSVALAPDNMKLRQALTVAYAHAGRVQDARQTLATLVPTKTDGRLIRETLDQLGFPQGERLFRGNRLDKALKVFQHLHDIAPDDPLINLRIGQILERQQQLSAAVAAYQKVLKTLPDNIEANLGLGEIYTKNQKVDEAITVLEKVIARSAAGRASQQAAKLLAQLYPRKVQQVLGALNTSVPVIDSAINLGKDYLRKRRFDEARQLFEGVLKQAPENAQAHYWLGQLLVRRGQTDAGIAEIERSVKLAPTNMQLKVELGKVYERADKLDAAIDLYGEIISRARDKRITESVRKRRLLVQARRLTAQAKTQEALAVYLKLQQQYPDDPRILELTATTYERLGKTRRADALFERLQQRLPNDVRMHYRLAVIYAKRADQARSREQLRKVLKLQPRGGIAVKAIKLLGLNEGLQLMENHHPEQALAAFQRVLDVVPDNPLVNFNAGVIYQQQQRYPEAEKAFKRVLAAIPDHSGALLRLGRLYVVRDRLAKAIEAFEKVVALASSSLPEKAAAHSLLKPLYARRAHQLEESLVSEVAHQQALDLAKKLLRQNDLGEARGLLDAVLAQWPKDAQGHYWLGQAYLRQKKLQEGVAEIAQSVALAPENLKLRMALGRAYEQAGQPADAQQVYEGLLKTADNAEILRSAQRRLGLVKAKEFSRQGDHEAAAEEYQVLLKRYPQDVTLYGLLAASYAKLGRLQDLARVLRKQLSVDPANDRVRLLLARVYEQQGEHQQAATQLVKIIRHAPDSKYASQAVERLGLKEGKALLHADKASAALEKFRQVLAVLPDDSQTNYYIGLAYHRLKKYTQAEAAFKKVLKKTPGNVNTWVRLGVLYTDMARNDDAYHAFQQVTKIAAGTSKAKEAAKRMSSLNKQAVARGRSLLNNKKLSQAEKILNSLIARDPENPQAYYWLSQVHMKRKAYGKAIKTLEKTIVLRPKNSLLLKKLAEAYQAGHMPDKAEKTYLKVLRQVPYDAEVYLKLAEIYEQQGQQKKAEQQVVKLLGLEPTADLRQRALDLLGFKRGKALLKRGKRARAEKIFGRLLAVAPDDPEVNSLLGDIDMARKAYKQAEAAYLKALKAAQSDRSEILLRLGKLYTQTSRDDDAIRVFNDIISQDMASRNATKAKKLLQPIFSRRAKLIISKLPSADKKFARQADKLIDQASKMVAAGGLDGAGLILDALLSRQPDNPRALYWLGQVNIKRKDFVNAVVLLKKCNTLAPGNSRYLASLGKAYQGARRDELAARAFEAALKHDPANVEIHLLLAESYQQLGQKQRAESHFGSVLRLAPQGNDADHALKLLGFQKGLQFLRQKELQDALKVFEHILTLAPEAPRVNFNAGIIYQQQQRYEDAEKSFKKVIQVIPEDRDAWLHLGRLYVGMGKLDQAIASFEKVVSLGKNTGQAKAASRSLKPLYVRRAHQLAASLAKEGTDREAALREAKKMLRRGELGGAKEILAAVLARWPRDAQGHYWLGQVYLKQRKRKAGIEEVEQSIALAPTNMKLKLALGKTYERLAMLAKAQHVYEVILKSADDAGLLQQARKHLGIVRGQRYSQAGKHRAAVAEYQALLKRYPRDPILLGLLGWSYVKVGQAPKADMVFEKMLSLAPDDIDIHWRMAKVYRRRGEAQQYIQQLVEIITLQPNSHRARQALNLLGFKEGVQLQQQGERGKALKIFLRILSLVPDEPLSNFQVGEIYLRQRKFQQAEAAYQKVLKTQPNNLAALLKLGKIYQRTGRENKAITHFEQLIAAGRHTPQGKQALQRLTHLYAVRTERLRQSGKLDSAIHDYETLLTYDPDNMPAHFNLALMLKTRQQYDNALKELQEVLRLAPDNKNAYINIARIRMRQRDYRRAVNAYAHAIALQTDEKSARRLVRKLIIALAKALLGEDRPAAALQTLETFRFQDTGSSEINYYLGVIYRQEGDLQAASSAFRDALEVAPNNVGLRYNLAILYERTDEDQLALNQYREILKRGKPGNTFVERARRRKIIVGDRLRRFTSRLNYSINVGDTTIDQNDRNNASSSFSSTVDYNLATRFRPRKNLLLTVNTGFSFATDHTSQNDSLVPRVGLLGSLNFPDKFFNMGANFSESHGLLLDSFAGRSFAYSMSGGLRLKEPLDFLRDLFRRQAKVHPEQGESMLERAPEPPEEQPEEKTGPDTGQLKKALETAFDRLIPDKKEQPVPVESEEIKRHVVVKGDTLWGISAELLGDPYLWPEIWQVNPDIENPHLIFPGDIITLIFVGGKPVLTIERNGEVITPPPREVDLNPEEQMQRKEQIRQNVVEGIRLFRQGLAAMQREDNAQALGLLEQLHEVVPDDPLVNLNLGRLYLRLQRLSDAEQAGHKVLQIKPADPDARLLLGRVYAAMAKIDQALPILRKLAVDARGTPRAVEADKLLRVLLQRKAETLLAQPKLTEQDITVVMKQGRELLEKNDLSRASKVFHALLKVLPDYAAAYYWLSQLELQQGKPDAATAELEQAVHHAPENQPYRYALGLLYAKQGELGKAIRILQMVIAQSHDEALLRDARFQTGLLIARRFNKAGSLPAALTQYEALLADAPDNVVVLQEAAEILDRMGQREEAAQSYEHILRLDPGNIPVRLQLAALEERMQAKDKMLADLGKVLELGPDEQTRRTVIDRLGLQQGLRLLRQGRLDEALVSLKQVLEVVPDDALARLNIGIIYMLQKRYNEAEAMFTRVLETDPRILNARYRLGLLYAETGRNDKAILTLEQLVQQAGKSTMGQLAAAKLTELEQARLKKLTGPKTVKIEPRTKTFQVGLSYNNFVPENTVLTDTKTWGANFLFTYPSIRWGNWFLSYNFTNTQNEESLGTDYAFTAHQFRLSVNRPVFGVPRLFGIFNLSRKYANYSNQDSNARFALGINAERRTIQDAASLSLNYRIHDDLTLTLGYSYSRTRANLPVGFVFAPNGRAVALQSASLGDFTSSFFNVGLNLRF